MSATVIVLGTISAVPSNDTPPISLAIVSFVAAEALPVKGPENPVAVNKPVVAL